MRLLRVGLLAVLVLLPAAAFAQTQAPTARLDVDANPACSSRDELVARVAARSTRIRFVNDAAGVPALAARIEVGPRGGVIADLSVVEPDGRKFARRIEAPSCAAATDALALVVAITLDPSVATTTTDGSRPAPSSSADAAPTVTTPPPPPPPPKPPEPEAETTRTAARPDAPTPEREAHGFLVAGVAGGAISGPAPTVMPGAGVEVQAGLERGSIWSPALMLSFAHAWSGDIPESANVASFTLDLVGLDLCPGRVVLWALEARVCAAGAVGRLAGQGSHTFDPTSVARPFATAGGALRLTVPFGARVQFRVRVGAEATLWRDAFEFTPDVFHRAASVTLMGDAGAGVRFP